MVVAANPLAAKAGLEVLRRGGTAADAAVTVQAVLALVEPQSSSLSGGAFITYFDARSAQVTAYNGRETAPAGATPDMFLGADRKPLPFFTAVLSGRSTGVPGALAALELLQREHGKLTWRSLFADAWQLASDGFTVSPRLAGMIASRAPQASQPDAVRYFSKSDGTRLVAGDTLRNPAYAATIERIAREGTHVLYYGSIAEDIVRRVHEGEYPGTLSLSDMAHYRPEESQALCHPWQIYILCVPPPPSGGIGLLEGLLLLADTDIAKRRADDPVAWVELGEAERLMYADRDRYVGDPDFVHVPVAGLLDTRYIRDRAAMIGEQMSPVAPKPGNPPGAEAMGPDHTVEPGGTTHFIIVDPFGNVVSMTTTVESIFGSGRMVDGFFLNNQLTDFSFEPTDQDGQPAANAVAPNKRPRSAMAPAIVLDAQGHVVAAAGSAGGPAIIAYVMKTLVASLNWNMPMREATGLPNLIAHGANFTGEPGKFGPVLMQGMASHGLNVHASQYEESGLTGLRVLPDGSFDGGADPRREGIAVGY
ncbi:MAG TPA: gamma-glutamyltransferase family protein [Steroidobacteraceae bacterium]|jgi:gamma-glutamyltranspeptidase/glutathione hydrolase